MRFLSLLLIAWGLFLVAWSYYVAATMPEGQTMGQRLAPTCVSIIGGILALQGTLGCFGRARKGGPV